MVAVSQRRNLIAFQKGGTSVIKLIMLFKIMLDEELQAMVGILNDNMNTICQEWVHLSARKFVFFGFR
jgi:hypothetical protein